MRFFILLFIILIFTGCEEKEELKQEVVSTKAIPEITNLQLIDSTAKSYNFEKKGSGFDFGELKGKIILLDFFATWCPPCKAVIPHLVNIQKDYSENLQIVGVLLEEDKNLEETKKFMEENSMNYIILTSGDISSLVKSVGGVRSIPFMIMYDANGEYFTHYIGAIPEEMIVSDIKRAMKK